MHCLWHICWNQYSSRTISKLVLKAYWKEVHVCTYLWCLKWQIRIETWDGGLEIGKGLTDERRETDDKYILHITCSYSFFLEIFSFAPSIWPRGKENIRVEGKWTCEALMSGCYNFSNSIIMIEPCANFWSGLSAERQRQRNSYSCRVSCPWNFLVLRAPMRERNFYFLAFLQGKLPRK